MGKCESRYGDDTKGNYWVVLPDGRKQNVNYYVNGYSGYVADVTYDGYAKGYTAPAYSAPAYRVLPTKPLIKSYLTLWRFWNM